MVDIIRTFGPQAPAALEDGVVFPGHGLPWRESDNRPGAKATKWARLTQGQPVGGRAVIRYDSSLDVPQIATTPFFDYGGDDHDAEQVQIVIDAPRAIWLPFSDLAGESLANLTGEYDNIEIDTADNFPGTGAPIIWPPLSVFLEWGTLTKTRMIVDIANGCRVNISASWARAYAVVTDDAANQPGTSAAYALRAFATPGWPTSQIARRTVWLGNVADGAASSVFAVPLHAREATVAGCSTATPPAVTVAYIRFYQDPAKAHGAGAFLVNANQPLPFRIPNGAAYFDVVNGSGAALHFATMFDLDG